MIKCKFCNKEYELMKSFRTHLKKDHSNELDVLRNKKKKERTDKYYLKNRDKILAKNNEWKLLNKDRLLKKQKEYSEKPETVKKWLDRRIKIWQLFNNKCESCNEKLDLTQQRVNLEIHHKFYSNNDKKKIKENGAVGASVIFEIEKMINNKENIHKKFTLLCRVCNVIEAFVKLDPEKSIKTFHWLYKQGYFKEIKKYEI